MKVILFGASMDLDFKRMHAHPHPARLKTKTCRLIVLNDDVVNVSILRQASITCCARS